MSLPTALTRSTSLSNSVSEGKCLLIRSATLSFRSTLGTGASLCPSPEDWTTGTEDRCCRTSLRKSARPPDPARTSQGMLFLRERSTLWQISEQKRLQFLSGTIIKKSLANINSRTSSMFAPPDTSIQMTGISMLPLPGEEKHFFN